ncbi:MAG: TetR/AcrR family transcriptional regulator [Eggerthellaceae bacterium]|jgi:AcrR family transcriptional regulator
MGNSKNNRSVQRTRAAIQQAFYELAQTKDVSRITVRELTERSGVSRGTFYLHYHDVYDLLSQREAEILAQLAETLEEQPLKDDSGLSFPRLYAALCFAREHRDWALLLLGSVGGLQFRDDLESLVCRECLDAVEGAYGQLDSWTEEAFSKFAAAGYIKLVCDWLGNGCKEDPRMLSEFAGQLISRGILSMERNEAPAAR